MAVRDFRPEAPPTGCMACGVRQLCLPAKLNASEIERFSAIVHRRGPFKRGDIVYAAGDPLDGLHVVQAGALKTHGVTGRGVEHVARFHLPGELAGTDAIHSGVHPWYTVALERTWLCAMSFEQLSNLAREVPPLGRALVRTLSRELSADEAALMTLGKMGASQRLTWFLNDLHTRYAKTLGSAEELHLPMTRADIASYLGMTTETVSRLLARLQSEGVIEFNGRSVRLSRAAFPAQRCL